MAGSAVTAFSVDTVTGANLETLGTTTTDASGNFAVAVSTDGQPVRLQLSGGVFTSEQDGASITPRGQITVLLPSAATNISGISINPLTTFIDTLATGKLETGGTNFSAAVTSATARIESDYALRTDPDQLLPDYSVAGVGTDAGKLGLTVGALINEDQHLCPSAPGELVSALAKDIGDGTFDGRQNGSSISFCGGNLPAIAGTSDFLDALAGVQQLQYVSAAFSFGGLYGPAGNILVNQNPAVTPDLLVPSVAAIGAAISQAAPSTSSTSTPAMNTARASATATLLRSGKVLIAGGMIGSTAATNETELYDPATNTMSAGPPMLHARGEASAVLLPNGNVLIIGGFDGSTYLSSTEIYHGATSSFVAGPTLLTARAVAGSVLLPSGQVLVAGGIKSGGSLNITELWDPATDLFSAGPSMNNAPGPCTALLLPNGKVFINGSGVVVNGSSGVSVADLYDPFSNSITEISLNTQREFAANVLLPNGKVLIAGGFGNLGTLLASTQIYDPSQNDFSDGPSMTAGHWVATTAPTGDGKVLVIGGNGNGTNAVDNVEIYDTASDSFTSGASMSEPRLFPTATLLPNGRVLVAGGVNGTNGSNYLSSTELYQP